jgi:hypothetical protein
MGVRQTYDSAGMLVSTEWVPDTVVALFPIDLVALFTPSELLALETSTSLAVVAFRTQFFAAVNPIAIDDPRFTGAVAIMQQLSILTPERAAAVLENRRPA